MERKRKQGSSPSSPGDPEPSTKRPSVAGAGDEPPLVPASGAPTDAGAAYPSSAAATATSAGGDAEGGVEGGATLLPQGLLPGLCALGPIWSLYRVSRPRERLPRLGRAAAVRPAGRSVACASAGGARRLLLRAGGGWFGRFGAVACRPPPDLSHSNAKDLPCPPQRRSRPPRLTGAYDSLLCLAYPCRLTGSWWSSPGRPQTAAPRPSTPSYRLPRVITPPPPLPHLLLMRLTSDSFHMSPAALFILPRLPRRAEGGRASPRRLRLPGDCHLLKFLSPENRPLHAFVSSPRKLCCSLYSLSPLFILISSPAFLVGPSCAERRPGPPPGICR